MSTRWKLVNEAKWNWAMLTWSFVVTGRDGTEIDFWSVFYVDFIFAIFWTAEEWMEDGFIRLFSSFLFLFFWLMICFWLFVSVRWIIRVNAMLFRRFCKISWLQNYLFFLFFIEFHRCFTFSLFFSAVTVKLLFITSFFLIYH